MGDGHGVDLERLAAASQEIIGCVPQPQQTDLASIIGDTEWYGHDGVYEAFGQFCLTWQLATKVLSARVISAGDALYGVAQTYAADDEAANRAMTGLAPDMPPL